MLKRGCWLLFLGAMRMASAADLPDARQTPGAVNPDITQATIAQTICVPGYSRGVRPPMSFTDSLKRDQIALYGYADTDTRHYEEDHLVPLSLGGAPTDPHNLWPQPRHAKWGAARKDELEFVLHEMVCHGEIPLVPAQQAIEQDWIRAWKDYVPSHPQYRVHGTDAP